MVLIVEDDGADCERSMVKDDGAHQERHRSSGDELPNSQCSH